MQLFRKLAPFQDCELCSRVVGTAANVPWPAHSPDLNPLDFSFWGMAEANISITAQLEKEYQGILSFNDKNSFKSAFFSWRERSG